MAKSFLNWGKPTDTPQKGDIAVFHRGDPSAAIGHVAFVDSVSDGKVKVLGGNQSHGVNYLEYPMSRVAGFRTYDGQSPTVLADASGAPSRVVATVAQNGYQSPATAEAAPAPVVSDEQKKAYADQISQMKQKQDDAETKQLQSMMTPTSGGDPLAAMKEHIKSVIQANQARTQVGGGSEQPQSQAAPAPAQQQPRRGGLWDVLKKYG
jgi:hypothetical protein